MSGAPARGMAFGFRADGAGVPRAVVARGPGLGLGVIVLGAAAPGHQIPPGAVAA
jgi:hypothetical protein